MVCNCENTPWFICQTILCGILWFQYCQKDFLSSLRRKLNHRLCVRRATIGEEFWGDQVKRLGLQWLQVSAQIWMAHPQSLTDHGKEKWMKTQWTITHLVSPHVRIDSQTAPTWYMKVWAWQFPPHRCHEFGFDNLACRDYQCVAMRRSHFCSRTFIHNGHLEFHANVLDFCNCMKRMRAFATCMCMHFRLFVACVCKFSRFFSCTSTFAHTPTLHALSGQATSFAWDAGFRSTLTALITPMQIPRRLERSAQFWWLR